MKKKGTRFGKCLRAKSEKVLLKSCINLNTRLFQCEKMKVLVSSVIIPLSNSLSPE